MVQGFLSDNGKTYSIIDLFLNGKELVLVSMNVGTCFLVNTLVYYGVERGMRLIMPCFDAIDHPHL